LGRPFLFDLSLIAFQPFVGNENNMDISASFDVALTELKTGNDIDHLTLYLFRL
jgi:hypothetical protein